MIDWHSLTCRMSARIIACAVLALGAVALPAVAAPPSPPSITSANSAAFPVGQAGSFTFTATGNPTPTYALSGCTVPAALGLNTPTGVLSGTPAAGTAGNYSCTLTATNSNGNATQAFTLTLTVQPGAQPSLAGPVRYAYDQTSRLIGVIAGNGNASQYVYDGAGNIKEIKNLPASVTALIDFAPKRGPIGTAVTLTGTGFSATAAQNTVKFNGVSASVSSATTNQLVVAVPTGATTGPITVTTPNGTATTSQPFTVGSTDPGAPTIASFSPTIAAAGTTVTVNGTNFDAAVVNNRISFNGRAGSVATANATALTAQVPALATSGHIAVTTPSGTAASTGDLYVPPSPYSAADIGANARLVINGGSNSVSLAAGKKGLFVFDASLNAAGIYLTNLTTEVQAYVRSPSGSVVTYTSQIISAPGGVLDPVSLLEGGTYSIFINPSSGAAASMTLEVGIPDLAISNASVGAVSVGSNGAYAFPVTFTVTNTSATTTASPTWYDLAYLSSSSTFDNTAINLRYSYLGTALAPGASYAVTLNVTTSTTTTPGNYTVFAKTNGRGSLVGGSNTDSGYLAEGDATNNVASMAITLPTK